MVNTEMPFYIKKKSHTLAEHMFNSTILSRTAMLFIKDFNNDYCNRSLTT